MSRKIILTGDRPTGHLHIGHYVGSLKQRVLLQEKGDYEKMFIMIADTQALTDNAGNPQKVRDNVLEVMLDYLSVGLDPQKVTFFVQSEIKFRGFDNENKGIPVGFANYPISQAADITAFKATLIPVGEDQLPMIEQAREIVRSFNNTYQKEILVEPDAYIPENKICSRLPGTDGNAKMSKSLNNCIYLCDDKETVKAKIRNMYTDPNHIKVTDPGNVEGNVVFTYLDAFSTDEHFEKYLPEYKNLDELKAHYRRGGLGDVKIKNFLNMIMEEILEPMRERRKYYEARLPEVLQMLKNGTEEAAKVADETLAEVKEAMGINYFNDEEFLKEQVEKHNKIN